MRQVILVLITVGVLVGSTRGYARADNVAPLDVISTTYIGDNNPQLTKRFVVRNDGTDVVTFSAMIAQIVASSNLPDSFVPWQCGSSNIQDFLGCGNNRGSYNMGATLGPGETAYFEASGTNDCEKLLERAPAEHCVNVRNAGLYLRIDRTSPVTRPTQAASEGAPSVGKAPQIGADTASVAMSNLMDSIGRLQDAHIAAVNAHQEDQARDAELTAAIGDHFNALSPYFSSPPIERLAQVFDGMPAQTLLPSVSVDHAGFNLSLEARRYWQAMPASTLQQRAVIAAAIELAIRTYHGITYVEPDAYHSDELAYQTPPLDEDYSVASMITSVAGNEQLALLFLKVANIVNEDRRPELLYAAADSLLDAAFSGIDVHPGRRAPSYDVHVLQEFAPLYSLISSEPTIYGPKIPSLQIKLKGICVGLRDYGVPAAQIPVCGTSR